MPIRRAFSLIELLVTIAIIAILLSILTPALGKARDAARLAVSMSNLRQIMAAKDTYGYDNDGEIPTYRLNYRIWNVGSGWNTWTYGGTWCNEYWRTYSSGRHDVWPNERPLNPYLYPDTIMPGPSNVSAGPTPEQREAFEMPVYRSPGDQFTHQRQGTYRYQPAYHFDGGSYEDVGTSYHMNMKWHRFLDQYTNRNWYDAYDDGLIRLKLASDYSPSRFVFVHDETADTVAHTTRDEPVTGEFGERNKSALAFMDGHVAYQRVELRAFQTQDYTYVFETLAEFLPDPDGD